MALRSKRMDVLAKTYRRLNPFVRSRVEEIEIWGEEDSAFCDVESIHQKAFSELLSDVEQVKQDHVTRVRFLVGASGVGKSHLFARLRRRLGRGQFTFVSNPPADQWTIKRLVLIKVILGMKKPALSESGPLPYSQLQRIVYALLRSIRRYPGLPANEIHKAWKEVHHKEYYPREEELFVAQLEKHPNIDVPLEVARVLFRVLDAEKRGLATAWLSGSQGLTDVDHGRLGVSGPLEDHQVVDVLRWIGSLALEEGPVVIVLDQLDGLKKSEQIDQIESILIDLKDSGRNFLVIASLLHEKFDFWNSNLSDPFKGRFGTTDGSRTRLRVSELSALTPEQARNLLLARLSLPSLVTQRQLDGRSDRYYPLTEEIVEQLAESSSGGTSAGSVLQRASDRYVEVVTGLRPPSTPLSDFVGTALADIIGHLRDEDLPTDTSSIADRIGELFGLISVALTGSAPDTEAGPLHRTMGNFRGSDRVYRANGSEVRVIGFDVQQGKSFPSLLKKIVDAPPNTILVRDGRIRVSGAVTTQLLTQFRKDKSFFHLPLDEIKNLHALGALLAKMREGDFQHEDTDPKPTEENFLKCLALQADLVEKGLSREFKRLVGLEQTGRDDRRAGPDALPPPPPYSIVDLVTKIMERERWLAFERLCVRVVSSETSASRPQIYDCLRSSQVRDKVMLYPMDSSPLEGPAIIVWTAES